MGLRLAARWRQNCGMRRVLDERALWLSRHVLPHESALRAWLMRKRVVGLEVDDIVQETYAKLASLESVDEIRDGKTYSFQIAHSIIVSYVRRSRIVSIRAAANLDDFGAAAPEPSPERQIEDRDELQQLAELITSLPEKSREVIMLRRVEGLSQRETAERLGVTESTVEKNMGRAIRLLMAAFGRGGKSPSEASRDANTQLLKHGKADTEPTG